MSQEEGHILDRRHRTLYHRVGLVGGAVLMVVAAVAVVRNDAIADSLRRAWASPNWDALALLMLSVVAMQLLSAGVFHTLMRVHGRVRFWEMNALVAASTLGNYVPMQMGSIGRVAYHHAVNGIPVRASLVAIVQAMVATAIALALLGAAALFVHAAAGPWWVVCLVPLLWLPVMFEPRVRVFAVVIFLRSIEILVWVVHAWAAFRLSGWPIGAETALWVALVGSVANLVPFVGNGLGLREWAVALAAPMLGGYERDAGLAAELVGRAVDVAIAVPFGLIGFSLLVRHARAAVAARTQPQARE